MEVYYKRRNEMKIYNIGMFGNYSESYGWDDGITSISVSEWSKDRYMEAANSVVGNSYYRFPFVDNLNENLKVVFNNCYGGSRNIDAFLLAENEEEALKKAKQWVIDRYGSYPE